MSEENKGNQILVWDYKHPVKGREFNQLLRNAIKPGIYKGGELTFTPSSTTAQIAPFVAFLNVENYGGGGDNKLVRLETTTPVTINVPESTPVIYVRFLWKDQIVNWADFAVRDALASPVNNEIKFGQAIYSGGLITGFDLTDRDIGLFNENYKAFLEEADIKDININTALTLGSGATVDLGGNSMKNAGNPVDDQDLVTKSFGANNYLSAELLNEEIEKLYNRLEATEQLNLEQELNLSYLKQGYDGIDGMIECFFNEKQTEQSFETAFNKVADIQDDCNWNNNWKERDDNPSFKNGYMRQRKQTFMAEVIDHFNLEGIGQSAKCDLSQWDETNQCHWFMSNAGGNAIGEITKLSRNMKDGKLEVIARYYLPAGGTASYWTGIDSDGENLFFTLMAEGTASTIYRTAINDDGTIGNAGYTCGNGETLNITGGEGVVLNTSSIATGRFNDVCIWGEDEIMVMHCDDTGGSPGTHTLIFYDSLTSSLAENSSKSVSGFELFVGGATTTRRAVVRYGDDLYIRVNDHDYNVRFIYKFNVSDNGTSYTGDLVGDVDSNPSVFKASGRWQTTRDSDESTVSVHNCGISISVEGDLLEVTSLTSASFITRRSIKNALWAENQIVGEIPFLNDEYIPEITNSRACMVEANRYYWTADFDVASNTVDIFRFDKQNGTYKHARLLGRNWQGITGMATDDTNLWLLGYDNANNYEIFFGSLSSFVGLMSTPYNTGNTIVIGTGGDWGTISNGTTGIGASNKNVLRGLCYDGDADILYILNTTDYKIDTLDTDGTNWFQGVYELPTPYSEWYGMAYKDGKIFLMEYMSTNYQNQIHVMDKNLSDTDTWYRLHTYIDPSEYNTTISLNTGCLCLALDGNDIVCVPFDILSGYGYVTGQRFIIMKTLEDPDVLQLHTFIDGHNILIPYDANSTTEHTDIRCTTPIIERYFDDISDYADSRDMPDKYYCAVGYTNEGMSVLHLDEFLTTKSSTGKDRYDVRKIRVQHFKIGGTAVGNLNMIGRAGTGYTNYIIIDKEIIISGGLGATFNRVSVIDLKSGKSIILGTGTSYSGYYYNGSITERNDGKGYIGIQNTNLDIFDQTANKSAHIRTFTKEDVSDYDGENPKTFAVIGHNSGCDLLVFDWDEDNNRTLVKVWNSLFDNEGFGRTAKWIAPSGYLFIGTYNVNGQIWYGNAPVWEVSGDLDYDETTGHPLGQWGATQIGTNILGALVYDIAPNSRCWKTPTGEWRHQLLCGTYDTSNGTVYSKMALIDVENKTIEKIWEYITGDPTYEAWYQVDMFEDLIFGVYSYDINSGQDAGFFSILKKEYFDSYPGGSRLDTGNHWTHTRSHSYIINSGDGSRPLFYNQLFMLADGVTRACRYSPDQNILHLSNSMTGIQLVHFPHMDESQHKSIEFDCNNPTTLHFTRTALLPTSEKPNEVSKDDANVSYTDGDTETWNTGVSVNTVQGQDASNVEYGAGTFGDPAKQLTKNATPHQLLEGTDYNYDARLDQSGGDDVDIYDDGLLGTAFNTGKFMRIVEGGANISGSLAIYAKELIQFSSPPKDRAYIDPERGKFVLPRPTFWSKCEGINNLINTPEIKEPDFYGLSNTTGLGYFYLDTGKINNAVRFLARSGYNQSGRAEAVIYPHGNTGNAPESGTISFWAKSIIDSYPSVSGYARVRMFFGNVEVRLFANRTSQYIRIYINDVNVSSYNVDWRTAFFHIYVVWDENAGLDSSKTIRVFVNGTERCSTTNAIDVSGTPLRINPESSANAFILPEFFDYLLYFDNLKTWVSAIEDHAPSTPANWIYNLENGGSIDGALHEIYGSGNNYIPVLDDSSTPYSGVGYHWVFSLAELNSINEDGVIEGYLEWENLTGLNRVGIYFYKTSDSGRAKINLINITDKITRTGDTDGSAIIINLSDTSDLEVGMLVEGSSVPDLTKIVSIDSISQITVDKNIPSDTGKSLEFYPCPIADSVIDLYISGNHEEIEKNHVCWIELNPTKEYKVRVDHNGDHNTSASLPHKLQVKKYLAVEPLNDAVISSIIKLLHTDYIESIHSIEITEDTTQDVEIITNFVGDGIEDTFELQDGNPDAHAVEPLEFYDGTQWLQPYSLDLTWGSNSPNYDNEEVTADGNLWVKFDTPPGDGNIVKIKWKPMVNKFYIISTIHQPKKSGHVDFKANVRELDRALQLTL